MLYELTAATVYVLLSRWRELNFVERIFRLAVYLLPHVSPRVVVEDAGRMHAISFAQLAARSTDSEFPNAGMLETRMDAGGGMRLCALGAFRRLERASYGKPEKQMQIGKRCKTKIPDGE
ncbi:hypothetical protein QQF64_004096 [Cirrhinus molitorella]|uniref:Uncharacterized protein n=1 Tax=Cirrhinus molitorella TaxID=172907 RepID=A0ABR3MN65_9TELE